MPTQIVFQSARSWPLSEHRPENRGERKDSRPPSEPHQQSRHSVFRLLPLLPQCNVQLHVSWIPSTLTRMVFFIGSNWTSESVLLLFHFNLGPKLQVKETLGNRSASVILFLLCSLLHGAFSTWLRPSEIGGSVSPFYSTHFGRNWNSSSSSGQGSLPNSPHNSLNGRGLCLGQKRTKLVEETAFILWLIAGHLQWPIIPLRLSPVAFPVESRFHKFFSSALSQGTEAE